MPPAAAGSGTAGSGTAGSGTAGGTPASPALLRGVDLAAFAVAFALRLRHAGVAVGFADIETFARALAACPPDGRSQLYWLSRVGLIRRHADLAVFDAVFDAVFAAEVARLDPHARRRPLPGRGKEDDRFATLATTTDDETDGEGLPWATLPRVTGLAGAVESDLAVPERQPSRLEGLADTPFESLDAGELALLEVWLSAALRDWPRRRSRRLARSPTGRRIALRPTMAGARRTGWEPVELARTRPVDRPRRVVMLCDVSQSMQAYAAVYLHLMRAVTLSADAEVFAFATSLTRLTRVLRHRSPAVAIEQASAKVSDRFGGTRIAGNLRALLASRHGNLTRGAIVIVASDGWDSDAPGELGVAMARLHRRAHRVIWLNPRVAAPGFEPLVGAMAAALPFCDELLPGHTPRALAEVVRAVARR